MTTGSTDVEQYIEAAPKEAQPRLREMRAAIRDAAPEAVESLSYGIPFYRFKGEAGIPARLCYFGLLKGKVAYYSRPRYLQAYAHELAPYLSGKSALHFGLDTPIPVQLIKKLVRNGVEQHTAREDT